MLYSRRNNIDNMTHKELVLYLAKTKRNFWLLFIFTIVIILMTFIRLA